MKQESNYLKISEKLLSIIIDNNAALLEVCDILHEQSTLVVKGTQGDLVNDIMDGDSKQ